jgi:hypothetical protein
VLGAHFGAAGGARHLGQLGGGHRLAEQADRQQVQDLGEGDRGDHGLAEVAGEDLIDVAGELDRAAAEQDWAERAQGRLHPGVTHGERGLERAEQAGHGRQLNQELRGRAGDRGPRDPHREVVVAADEPATADDRDADQRGVPHHRRDVDPLHVLAERLDVLERGEPLEHDEGRAVPRPGGDRLLDQAGQLAVVELGEPRALLGARTARGQLHAVAHERE